MSYARHDRPHSVSNSVSVTISLSLYLNVIMQRNNDWLFLLRLSWFCSQHRRSYPWDDSNFDSIDCNLMVAMLKSMRCTFACLDSIFIWDRGIVIVLWPRMYLCYPSVSIRRIGTVYKLVPHAEKVHGNRGPETDPNSVRFYFSGMREQKLYMYGGWEYLLWPNFSFAHSFKRKGCVFTLYSSCMSSSFLSHLLNVGTRPRRDLTFNRNVFLHRTINNYL